MEDLSRDVIFHIGLFLPPQGIARLGQTNKKYHHSLTNPRLWIHRLKEDFGICCSYYSKKPKSLYQHIYLQVNTPTDPNDLLNRMDRMLVNAVEKNDTNLITATLHCGADPTASTYGEVPDSLRAAVIEGYLHILIDLMQLNPDITLHTINYLFVLAAESGHLPLVGFLLGYGADDIAGALEGAANEEMMEVVDFLLKHIN